MPSVIENIQLFLLATPASYLWALAALFILLLLLLVTRRRKNRLRADPVMPNQVMPDQVMRDPVSPGEAPPDKTPIDQEVARPEVRTETPPAETPEEVPPVSTTVALSSAAAPIAIEEISEPPVDEPQPVRAEPVGPVAELPEIPPEPEKTDATIPADVPETTAPPAPVVEKPSGLFTRLKQGLTKTRRFLNSDIDDLFQGQKKIDDDLLEEIEELLITADIGVQTTMDLIDQISHHIDDITDAHQLRTILKTEIQSLLKANPKPTPISLKPEATPRVIMVIGVNGVGKTTTIGKLAAHYTAENKKVLIAAADTFRAAAVEQAAIWAERSNADLVRHKDGSDPAAVAFDGVEAGLARGCDIVLIDTAGRLHTKVNLMEELKKIKRSVNKKLPGAPHEILLVLDATTGQNALTQAKIFHEALDVTGIALTKLDGTAKGGIVVSICHSLHVPLMYIGVGEQIDDLQAFDADKFVDALF